MKKLILMSALVLGGLSVKTAHAQIGLHVNLHFGTPAVAVADAPVADADYNDDYYYLPDVDAYYSVADQCYYYFDGDTWISAAALPGEYANFDWRHARRYEIHAARPFIHNDYYRSRFGGHADVFARADRQRESFDTRDMGREGNDHQQYDNRGWGSREQLDNRGYSEQRGEADRGQFENRGNGQQRGGEQQSDLNRGQWGGRNNYNQPEQSQRQPQQGRGQWGGQQQQQQPYQNNNGAQGHNWGGQQGAQQSRGNESQPSNQSNGGSSGSFGSGQHFTQNRTSFGGRRA